MKYTMIIAVLVHFPLVANSGSLDSLPDPTKPYYSALEKREKTITKQLSRQHKSRLSLQQIKITPFNKFAIINGKILSVGDTVMDATVVSILENRVFLQRKSKIVELQLVAQQGIFQAR